MNSSSSTRVFAIAGGVAVFLTLAWGLLLFRPELQHLSSTNKAQTNASGQVASMTGTVSSLQTEESKVPAAQKEYSALLAALPDNPQVTTAIDQVNAAAAASGFSVKSFDPTKPSTGGPGNATVGSGGVKALSVAIAGSGTYSQTLAFMTDLLNGSRIFEFTGVSYSATAAAQGATTQDPVLSSQLAAEIFYAGQPTP